MTNLKELKIWLVVREDLNMSAGKLAAQSGHAFMLITDLMFKTRKDLYKEYIENHMAKIVVGVDSKEELLEVVETAKDNSILTIVVADAGRTELKVPDITVAVFGPAYREDLPISIRNLKLLKE